MTREPGGVIQENLSRESGPGGFVRFMGCALSSIARSLRPVPIEHHGAESPRRFSKFNLTSTLHRVKLQLGKEGKKQTASNKVGHNYIKKFDCKFRSISLRILSLCLVSFFLAPSIAFAGGVTIITHGFNGNMEWVNDAAKKILDRNGGRFSVSEYLVIVDSAKNISITHQNGATTLDSAANKSGHVVIQLDWTEWAGEAPTPPTTYTGEVATWVVDQIIQSSYIRNLLFASPIHLIGHSRGGSLVGAMAKRLGDYGYWVDQVTFLDPIPIAADWGNDGMTVPGNVIFADNYYRTSPYTDLFDGEEVAGAYPVELNNSYFNVGGALSEPDNSYDLEHSDVHAWYRGTVPSSVPPYLIETFDFLITSDWYVADAYQDGVERPRNSVGYAFSLTANDGANRPSTGLHSGINGGAESRSFEPIFKPTLVNNVGYLTLQSTSVTAGNTFKADYRYESWTSDFGVEFYLDDDENPHNGYMDGSRLGARPHGVSTGIDSASDTLTVRSDVPAGTYFVLIKSTGSISPRFFYAPMQLTVAGAQPPPPPGSETVTIPASADTYVADSYPTLNLGNSIIIGVQTGADDYYGLVKFNLNNIPDGSVVDDDHVELRLYSSYAAGSQIYIVESDSSWSESTVTWNTKPTLGNGYGFFYSVSGIGYQNIKNLKLTDLVRGWVKGTESNYGVYLLGGNVGDSFSFQSSESSNSSYHPKLIVTYTPPAPPDLVVQSPSVNDSTLSPGQSFTISATVRNQGSGSSNITTLRYYRSIDSTINTSDTEVNTDSVSALSPGGTSSLSDPATAPSIEGTYYVGACVDAVSGESPINNQCSSGVQITVATPPPDLVVINPSVSDATLTPGQSFTVYATVRNQGSGSANNTTLRYYRSTNSTISTGDTPIGTDPVAALSPNGTSSQNLPTTAPSTDGTYWVGACVDPVSGESPINNQCSPGVQITVNDVGLPTVTITAPDAAAGEPSNPGTFTVSRTGSTSTSLTVYYGTSGTATAGSDYNSLSGSVTIPVGSATADITVTPIDDSLVEGNETVIATLSSNSNYQLGSPGSVTVTITDDESGFLFEDFESYPAGSFPSTWTPDANANDNTNNYVDNSVSYRGSNSLRLHGSIGGCWAALTTRPLTVSPPYEVELAIRNGTESLSGCHPSRASIALLKGTSWANPGRGFFLVNEDGTLVSASGNLNLGSIDLLTWSQIKIRYERPSSSETKITYWINGVFKGTETLAALVQEDQMTNLQLGAQEGTVWFDEISVLQSVLLDTDGDGTPDATDTDDDNDGVPDDMEGNYGTDPKDANDYPLPYSDVPYTHADYLSILVLDDANIVTGCGGGNFCPEMIATRDLVAIWLWKARNNPLAPPVASGAVYNDVTDTDFAADYILGVKNDGITEGCDASNYCPKQVLTKAQAAKMLLKAANIASVSGGTAVYDDVPDGHFAEDWIRGLKLGGYTEGCGGNNYCPDEALTLGGFAKMLAKTFGLVP